jgi:hypothetical protein
MPTPAQTFPGIAQGILENAPDLETGYQWLSSEYKDNEWDDPAEASRTMATYGTALRQKFRQNYFASNAPDSFQELDSQTPIKFSELPDPETTDPEERALAKITAWEKANLAYLDSSTETAVSLNRDLFAKAIPEVASRERRKIKDPNFFQDFAARVGVGVVAPVASLFGYETPEFLQENTNVDNDDDFLSEVASGIGTVGAAIGISAATSPVGGFAYLGAGAIGSTRNTYEEIKEQTGSTEQAGEAAAVEFGGQVAGLAIGAPVAGRLGGRLAKATATAFGKSATALAEGATQKIGNEIFKSALKNGIQQGAANITMRAGSNLAHRVGYDDENISLTEGLLRAGAVGAVLGSGATGAIEGYGGVAQRMQNRRVQRDLEGLREPAPEDDGGVQFNMGIDPTDPLGRKGKRSRKKKGETTPPPTTPEGEIVEPGASVEAVPFTQSSEGRETMLRMRKAYDEAVEKGDTETAEFLLGAAKRVAENKPIDDAAYLAEMAEQTDAAFREMAADLPDISRDGVAQSKGKAVKFKPLATPEQMFDPAEAKRTVRLKDLSEVDFFEEGAVTKTNADSSVTASPDETYGVTPEIASDIVSLKNVVTPDGKTPQVRSDGENLQIVSDYVAKDPNGRLDVLTEPTGDSVINVDTKENPGVGDALVQASGPLYGDGVVEHPSNVTLPIVEEVPKEPPPVGPEGANRPRGKTRQREVSRRLVGSKLPPEMIDPFTDPVAAPDGTPKTILRYVQQPVPELADAAQRWILEAGGDEAAINKLLRGPRIPESEEAGLAGVDLIERLGAGIENAKAAGDYDAVSRLVNAADQLHRKLAVAGTSGGRFVNALKRLQKLNPESALAIKIGQLTDRLYNEQLQREGVTPEQARREEVQLKKIDEEVKRIQDTAEAKPVELTELEKTELADTTKALEPMEEALVEKNAKLDTADERLIENNRKEIDRLITEPSKRAEDIDQRLRRLDDIEDRAELRERTTELGERIDQLEQKNLLSGLDRAEKGQLRGYEKELKRLRKQQDRIAQAREKLYKAKEPRLKPNKRELDEIDKLNAEITELTKGLQERSLKPESSLKPKDQERLNRLRERKAILKAKSEAKGEKALSAEQAKTIDKLLRRKEQLERKIENRTKKIEARLKKIFPDKMREDYKELVRAKNQLPEGDTLNRVNRELTNMERDLALTGWQKGKSAWFSFYISNVLLDLGTAMATAFGNTAQFASSSLGVIAGGPFRGRPISEIPRNFQEYTRQVMKDMPKAFQAAFDAFSHNYFNKWSERDFATYGFGDPTTMETPLGRNLARLGNNFKFVGYSGRLLSALDVFFSTLGGDAATAIRLLETTPHAANLRGEALRAFLSENVYGTAETQRAASVEAARQSAILKEAGVKVSKENERQIAEDILRRQLNPDIYAERQAFKEKISLTNVQKGAIGKMVQGLNNVAEIPAFSPFILFTRAMGNILALKVEHTPYGLLRPTLLKRGGQELNPLERSIMYTSAILGSAILGSAATAITNGYIQVHGNGPANANERRRWLDSGAKPFSIQIGDTFIGYGELPFATMLAGLGGYEDYKRYSKMKGKISDNEAANYIMAAAANSLFSNPLMQNAAQFFNILQEANQGGDVTGLLQNYMRRNVIEAGRNAILPTNRQLRNVTAMFQDPLDTKLSFQAAMLNGIPWVGSPERGIDLPALNVFGKPIYKGKSPADRFRSISRFYTQQVNDPAIRFLTDKGYYVTDLQFNVRIPESLAGVRTKREAKLGASYGMVLTDRERYELQRLSGPTVEKAVLAFRKAYGHSKWDVRIQEKLNEQVSEIRGAYRNKIIGESLRRREEE